MKTLVIIDGKSVFYRGYYAMGNLSRADGTPTGGVYGFAAIAMEIVKRLNPDKVVVAWDARNSAHKRKEIYPEYKAGRVKPPDDFYAQIPLLESLVAALGWGFMECDDYEADDIIGTLSLQADEEGDYMTYIVSSDLDMLQIVDANTRMYRILKGFSDLEELDVAAVEAKYGIKKAQFLDLKALKGDSSDNIPGVPGIGEKGAVKLLNEYESIEGVYAHINDIKGALRDKLIAGKDSAFMSYKLAKIMFDAPVKLEEVPDFEINQERIVKELKNLEFNSLIRKYQLGIEKKPKEETPVKKIPIPKDLIVRWDIKTAMHEDVSLATQILMGAKFWDLKQGAFLLDPLARDNDQPDLTVTMEGEYSRQVQQFEKLPKLYQIFTDFDLPLIPVLYKMEKRGMMIDREFFARLKKEFEAEVKAKEKKIWKLAGEEFNVNSPIQLAVILYDKLKLPTKGIKKKSRGYSTGAKELDKLKDLHPIIPALMEYREAAKLLSTYIIPLPELADENNRVHTTFTQDVTATGRLSSVNPNLQNIPVRTEDGKRIREGFVAAPGKVLVSADYSQFELRLAAVLSNDEKLLADFNSGVDIHTKTAAEAFGVPMDQVTKTQRRAAKVINFGVLYGMSVKGLSDAANMSMAEAKEFIDRYFELRKPMRKKMDEILKQAREVGFVETFFGRRRPTPDVKSSNYVVRTAAERAAENMPIQGTEADLMKRAMIMVDAALPEGAELIMQVHDSLIVECDEALADTVTKILQEKMENVAPELTVRLAVEATQGRNWGSL